MEAHPCLGEKPENHLVYAIQGKPVFLCLHNFYNVVHFGCNIAYSYYEKLCKPAWFCFLHDVRVFEYDSFLE